MKKITLSILFFLALYSSASAIDYMFIGSGSWSTASNWSGSVVPPNPLTTGNNIIISSNATLDINFVINSGATLTVNSGASLTISNGNTLTNDGTVTNNSGGTITNNGIVDNNPATSIFNNYGTYNGSGSGSLPIELTDFTPKRVGNTIELSWTTVSETNNAYMIVERSRDGIKFDKEVDRLDAYGNGNSKEIQRYAVTDKHPLRGTNYYRLRQVDKDGKAEYHKVESIVFTDGKGEGIQVFPTRVANQLHIVWDQETRADGEVFISNVMGQLLLRQAVGAGTQQQDLDLPALPAGTYFVTVQTERTAQTARFVKG